MKKIFMALFFFTLVMAKCEVPEICGDNKDNNQNGLIDENCVCTRAQTQDCDTGLPGICSEGKQACKLGHWSPCVQQTQPTAEICGDNLDNNCDGQINEGCTVTLNSLNQYEGYAQPDGAFAWFNQPIKSLGTGTWMQYEGFTTFNIDVLKSNPSVVSLKVYNSSEVGGCYGGRKHVYASVMQTTDDEYSLWQENCSCFTDPCFIDADGDGNADSPDVCKNPIPQNSITSFEMHKADQTKPWDEVDWWILDSVEFTDLVKQQFASRKYISFGFTWTCTDAPFTSWDGLIIEDGGNHVGTGNVPTLTFSY